VDVRAPAESEAAAVAELLNTRECELHGTISVTTQEVEHWWTVEVDRETRVRVAGRPLEGYADLARHGSAWWADVRCASVAAAEALLAWAESESGRPLRVLAPAADRRMADILAARGYRPIRSSFRMSIELVPDEIPAPAWPDGVAVRTMEPGEERVVYDARDEAFADHWEYVPLGFEHWRRRHVEHPLHLPDLWFLAVADGQVVGFALCGPAASGEDGHDWVSELGVRPSWRRRGIALALLRHAFRELAARDCRRVSLGVDAENPTGAVGLFERAGMAVVRRNDTFELRGA
jgi:ribosomal protein S18 acetylase RimI-like enzyme